MSDKLYVDGMDVKFKKPSMPFELSRHCGFGFEGVLKPAGHDLDEILLFFAPNTLQDLRCNLIRSNITMLKHTVLQRVYYYIENNLEFEKKHICYGSLGISARNFSELADLLLKVAREEGRSISYQIPMAIVKSQISFIGFTQTLATLFRCLDKTKAVPRRVYCELFTSFAEMHLLDLTEGAAYAGLVTINHQVIKGEPDFVCTRKDRPAILIKVYDNNINTGNNNDNTCANKNTPVKKEEGVGMKRETKCFSREGYPCDNCGTSDKSCSEISYLTAMTSDFHPECEEGSLKCVIKEEISKEMLVALCREDVPPYFDSPPRILTIIVEETRVRFARLKMDEKDVKAVRGGFALSECPVVQYTRPYNMLNLTDRKLLSPALLRLADVLKY